MASTEDPLRRAEAQLQVLTRRQEQETLDRWRATCVELAGADVARPAELKGWLRTRPDRRADEVLRALVTLAQRGDTVALLAVVVCLAPGIRTLARHTGISAGEAMSEVTVGILEFPVGRRRSIAGGLLLDARNRLTRAARRAPLPVEEMAEPDPARPAAVVWTAGGGWPSTAERVLEVICEARRRNVLDHDDAQLIVDTRLGGQRVAPAAARLGISAQAAYQRRTRAEGRMAMLAHPG